jgi:hypothetical protein
MSKTFTDEELANLDKNILDMHHDLLAARAHVTALAAEKEEEIALYSAENERIENEVIRLEAALAEVTFTMNHYLREFKAADEHAAKLAVQVAEASRRLAQDRALVFAIATESASELVKICGVHLQHDNQRLNYLAELFAPEPDGARGAPIRPEEP